MNILLTALGKVVSFVSRSLGKGNGSTWPGHIALNLNPNFIKDILKQNQNLKIVLIAGTNGKTTTGKLIRVILEQNNIRVIHNESGANLLNGLTSALILNSSLSGNIHADYAVFEVDENTLPLVIRELIPNYLIILNLFRDQLDRYGEVNAIAKKWKQAIQSFSKTTTVILNADDPQIAYLGLFLALYLKGVSTKTHSAQILYFGLSDKTLGKTTLQHAVDSTYCPRCGSKLTYSTIYYSHLGDWKCNSCKLTRPKLDINSFERYPLPGVYNRYNTLAAVLLTKSMKVPSKTILATLKGFQPAFGRQEIITYQNKQARLFLSKNPTSFNESLRTIQELGAKNVLFVLNDRIPDGRDVSWIWDVDFEEFAETSRSFFVSGDRIYDMALRLKYAVESQNSKLKSQNYKLKFKIFENLREAVNKSMQVLEPDETLYILPTYSAMLEVRKILTGKKIL